MNLLSIYISHHINNVNPYYIIDIITWFFAKRITVIARDLAKNDD